MILDTSAYMIAGFAVILGGVIIYILSIFIRDNQARHQADNLSSMWENRTAEFSDFLKEEYEK